MVCKELRPMHGCMIQIAQSLILQFLRACSSRSLFARGGGGGYSQKNWVGVCGPLPKNPTLFMTKICDIPYPIYDLTKNSKPYL